jgi:hypothetical protein
MVATAEEDSLNIRRTSEFDHTALAIQPRSTRGFSFGAAPGATEYSVDVNSPPGFKHPVDAGEEPVLVRDVHGNVLAPNHVEGRSG